MMGEVPPVRTAHTADVDAATLAAARALLYEAFDDMTEDDWEHSLGGVHALAFDGDALVGHAAVVQRRLLHGGRALRTGYVEGVAVRADQRRRGHGAAMMDALERVIRGAYDLGALGATDEASRSTRAAAGGSGRARARRSRRRASGAPRTTTAGSTCSRARSRSTSTAS